ncbi:MAG: cation:proton antiporter [Planctomycetota bacterium]
MPPSESVFNDPSLTIALALAVGLLCQALATHVRIPGLLLLLFAGVLVGPEMAGVVRPASLGDGLLMLVSFAVAVILFEGGMNLDIRRLRREQRSIQMLISVGALVTAVGGTLAAHFIMGWDWAISSVFGTLVIVTGPTVIGPLLKRIKVERSVSTVLEAEGVLIDAVGAIAAAATLEFVLSKGEDLPVLDAFLSLGFGSLFGLACGFALVLLFRFRELIPEGLEKVFTLGMVCAIFQVANAIQHESGVAAVTLAGLVVGNMPSRFQEELLEFKEQLTAMFIGLLFVLLAADVRADDVVGLGWPGVVTVLVLMFVVRPLNVFVGTLGSEFGLRQKAFMAWIGPRGIVAAAIASLVAAKLGSEHPVGPAFRALVFSVIALTVVSAGITGGPLARALRLQRPSNAGWVILGANELARTLAKVLQNEGQPVLCIDRNHEATRAAGEAGIRVIFGNGLEERTLQRAEIDTRLGAIGLSPNGEVNVLFAQKAKREGKVKRLYVALSPGEHQVTPEMARAGGAELLFHRPEDIEVWTVRLRRRLTSLERWQRIEAKARGAQDEALPTTAATGSGAYLFLALHRGGATSPVGDEEHRVGDQVTLLVHSERCEQAYQQLAAAGWQQVVEIAAVAEAEPATS